MKKVIYVVVTLAIVAVVALAVKNRIASEKESSSKEPKHKVKEKQSVVKVTTAKAVRGDIPISINCTGTARAVRSIKINSKVTATVNNLHVENGDFVKKGSDLVDLFSEEIDLAFENAQIELTKAKIDYGVEKQFSNHKDSDNESKDYSKLKSELKRRYRSGTINKKQYEDQLLEIEVSELLNSSDKNLLVKHKTGLYSKIMNFKRSRIDKDNCSIKAPFNGYIANLDLVEDQDINGGNHCLDLVDLSEIEVRVPVLETEIANLREGRAATLRFNAYPEEIFNGKVKHINPVLDDNSSTCQVVVSMENKDLKIKPGMSATVSIEGKIFEDRLIVPKEAIIVRDNRTLLFKVENNIAKWVYVSTGKENVEFVEILDKVSVGDEIVISNHYTLAHDAKLKIVNKN